MTSGGDRSNLMPAIYDVAKDPNMMSAYFLLTNLI